MTPIWSTSLPDWESRIIAGKSLMPCAPLFPGEAAEAMAVFNSLRMVDVPGQPTFGDAAAPWMTEFAEAVFGAYDPEAGERLITSFMLLVAKKNAKSTLAGAIMVTALVRNWRHSAEFLILAPTLEIAKNSYQPAADAIRADESLRELLHVQDHVRTITHRLTGATLKVVAADSETVSGKKATGVLIEELWLFGKNPRAHGMLREATGGHVSRPEGFQIAISTHSDEKPVGVFKARLDYFRAVRDGVIDDPKSVGVLYEWPAAMIEDEAYLDPANFYITNPNLGRSVRQNWLEEELVKEQLGDEADLAVFLAKHLNVEIGQNRARDRWAAADFWADAGEPMTLDALLAQSDVVTMGIDGGGLDDLLGVAVLGRHKETRRWHHWGRAWAHSIVLQRRKDIATTLKDFAADRDLIICTDATQDIREVADLCVKVKASKKLPEKDAIGVDKLGLPALVDELERRGFKVGDGGLVVGVSQGGYLHDAITGVERKLADGTFKHCGQPLMAWAIGNVKVELKGNATAITKQAAGRAKIDPVAALLNAAKLMAANPDAVRKPNYQIHFVG
ncbi:MAG: terminase large subunit [Mesorhizobium sp.]|nr:terminase TerL endonuclease subunit [Mesorhizobium sp.]MBL8576135.1 terminase large subunit [Mesorhizobium sp.]